MTQRDRDEQLHKSQKMEAMGQFAGRMAHDLNNLLTAINGYSSLALERTNPDDRIKIYLQEIRKAGERAANLTQQLLALTSPQKLEPAANLNEAPAGEDVQV